MLPTLSLADCHGNTSQALQRKNKTKEHNRRIRLREKRMFKCAVLSKTEGDRKIKNLKGFSPFCLK